MRYHQAVLISCEIPWGEDDNLLEECFRAEIRHFLRLGFNNLYIFGTAGEGYAIDTARFQLIVRVFSEETQNEGVFPQIGIIGLSTATVLERIGHAYRAGFRVFQISLPCWGALDDAELLSYFRDVCGAFPDAKFLHYNVARSKRVLNARDYRRLADEVPNLVATKNTNTTPLSTIELMRTVPEIQHFFSEAMFPIGCLAGECSLLSSFGPMLPSKTKQFFEYGRTRQIEKLFQMQVEYLELQLDIESPTRGHQLIDGAYDKLWVRLGEIDMPLRLLSPYRTFPEHVYEQCRRIFLEKYCAWIG